MRVAQCFGDLLANLINFVQRVVLPAVQHRLERSPGHEFHHQVGSVAFHAGVEHGHDTCVRQSPGGARLACKAFAVLFGQRTHQRRGVDGLHRHHAVHHRVAGFEHRTHSAAADFIEDFVTTKLLHGGLSVL